MARTYRRRRRYYSRRRPRRTTTFKRRRRGYTKRRYTKRPRRSSTLSLQRHNKKVRVTSRFYRSPSTLLTDSATVKWKIVMSANIQTDLNTTQNYVVNSFNILDMNDIVTFFGDAPNMQMFTQNYVQYKVLAIGVKFKYYAHPGNTQNIPLGRYIVFQPDTTLGIPTKYNDIREERFQVSSTEFGSIYDKRSQAPITLYTRARDILSDTSELDSKWTGLTQTTYPYHGHIALDVLGAIGIASLDENITVPTSSNIGYYEIEINVFVKYFERVRKLQNQS